MQERVSRIPVRPPVRLERLLWLMAALLAWGLSRAVLAAVAASASDQPSGTSGGPWLLLPLSVVVFELWLVVSAWRLRQRSKQPRAIELDTAEVHLPAFGLSRSGATIRYEDIQAVDRRGFGGAARMIIRHRHGRSSVPVAQVDEALLRSELAARVPGGIVAPPDEP